MSIADEFKELIALHESGVLSDEEFKQAKVKLLLTGSNEAALGALGRDVESETDDAD
jgi:hypothetical protein